MRLLALLSLLAGCNDLLGFGDPSLAALDAAPTGPGCATGWAHRVPIAIQNDSTSELRDYQIVIRFDTATPIRDHELQPTGDDLRFTAATDDRELQQVIESGLDTGSTTIWIAVPVIPIGGTTLAMYYGNPFAPPAATPSPFVQGIIANPSFEELGFWTVEPFSGPPATFEMRSVAWATDGAGSLLADEEVVNGGGTNSQSAISQPIVLPAGSDYTVRFDLDVIAASNGGINGANDGGFFLHNDVVGLWSLGATHNITGVYLGQETAPLSPGATNLTLGVHVGAGSGTGYAKAYFDNFRVRKHASPEPTVQVGSEQAACP